MSKGRSDAEEDAVVALSLSLSSLLAFI